MENALTDAPASRLDHVTHRWWFFAALLILFFLPAYAARPIDPRYTPHLVITVLSHASIYRLPEVFPLFKILPLLLIAWVVTSPQLGTRMFLGYAGLNLLLIAIFQDMAQTQQYGLVILVGNAVVYGLVGLTFLWSAARSVPFTFTRLALWRYWVIPFALLAYWFPAATEASVPGPDFSLARLTANEAGLTFCMILPVYLALLTLAYPNVNRTLLRISAFVGLVTGLLNVYQFFANPAYGTWLGVVHIPLLLISLYAFGLAMK